MTVSRIDIQMLRTIADVASSEWDSLAGLNVYASHAWHAAMEYDGAFEPRYLIARDAHGDLVGALPTFLWHGTHSVMARWYNPEFVFLQSQGLESSYGNWFPCLLLGARSGYFNDFLIHPGLNEANADRVGRRLISEALSMASELKAPSAAFMYAPAHIASRVASLFERDAFVLLSAVDHQIDVVWPSFDEYQCSLSRGRRGSVRREMKDFRASGLVISRDDFTDELCREAGPLVANVQHRYGGSETAAEMTEYLLSLARTLRNSSLFLSCRHESDLIGFSLYLDWRKALYSRVVGFSYDRIPQGVSPYFMLEFYIPLMHAIEAGNTLVSFGTASYLPKVHRGARPEPLWSVVASQTLGTEERSLLAGWNHRQHELWRERLCPLIGPLPDASWKEPGLRPGS